MKGFASDVTVTATLDNGTITALTVDASGETAGFGQKCAEEDFTAQFIGKTLPVTLGEDVDAVAGATITSTAVVDALNSLAAALRKYGGSHRGPRGRSHPGSRRRGTRA